MGKESPFWMRFTGNKTESATHFPSVTSFKDLRAIIEVLREDFLHQTVLVILIDGKQKTMASQD